VFRSYLMFKKAAEKQLMFAGRSLHCPTAISLHLTLKPLQTCSHLTTQERQLLLSTPTPPKQRFPYQNNTLTCCCSAAAATVELRTSPRSSLTSRLTKKSAKALHGSCCCCRSQHAKTHILKMYNMCITHTTRGLRCKVVASHL
jgi:hypothetical protein